MQKSMSLLSLCLLVLGCIVTFGCSAPATSSSLPINHSITTPSWLQGTWYSNSPLYSDPDTITFEEHAFYVTASSPIANDDSGDSASDVTNGDTYTITVNETNSSNSTTYQFDKLDATHIKRIINGTTSTYFVSSVVSFAYPLWLKGTWDYSTTEYKFEDGEITKKVSSSTQHFRCLTNDHAYSEASTDTKYTLSFTSLVDGNTASYTFTKNSTNKILVNDGSNTLTFTKQ